MSQPAPHAIETRNSSSVPVILSLLLGALALAAPALAPCATPVTSGAAAPASLATAQVVEFKPGMRMSALAGRAPSDLVEFSDGRRMHVGQLQRLQAWARRARGTPRRPIPAAFRARPAATGRRVGDASELLAALKRTGQPDRSASFRAAGHGGPDQVRHAGGRQAPRGDR